MPRLGDLDLHRHLRDPALKAAFVTPMFDLIAPRYDDFTRLFSFGMDRGWKRELIGMAAATPREGARDRPFVAVDLASGTGDLAFALAQLPGAGHVTGVDASREMVGLANARVAATASGNSPRPEFVVGDLGATGLRDASVDLVTASYAFRNGPPLADSLAEAARIIRPGGVLAVLDFYRPEPAIWRALFINYLRLAGNLVGWWWHREPVAYGYIAASIETFVTASEFGAALDDAGFDLESERRKLGGGIAIHVAVRRAAGQAAISARADY